MEKTSRHGDDQQDDFQPSPIAVAKDGGVDGDMMQAMVGQPAPVPERTPENFVCLRGPCRHYWHLVTMAECANPGDTWAALGIPEPRQHHHTCLVNPGFETDLGDDNAYSCSKRDPYTPKELVKIRRRRKQADKLLDASQEKGKTLWQKVISLPARLIRSLRTIVARLID